MSTYWETLQIDGNNVDAFVAEPESSGRHPGIVVIMGAGGIDDGLQKLVSDLAAHDFVAIAPYMFHRDTADDDGRSKAGRLLDVNIDKDVSTAIDYLRQLGSVDGERIGIVGFCLGGRVSYMTAARRPDLKAAAVFYGGNTMVARGEGVSPFEQSANINCPVIGFFGLDDQNPSPEDVQKIDAELTRLGKTHEFHSYPDAGHAFMSKGGPAYREHAAKDAWPKTLDFFKKNLVATPVAS